MSRTIARVCACGTTFRTLTNLKCQRCRGRDRVCACGTAFRGTQTKCRPCRPGYARESISHYKRYGLSPDAYAERLATQGGVCAGCLAPPGKFRLSVDHDHACCPGKTSCGKCIRALLCFRCNDLLRRVNDSAATLRRLASILDR